MKRAIRFLVLSLCVLSASASYPVSAQNIDIYTTVAKRDEFAQLDIYIHDNGVNPATGNGVTRISDNSGYVAMALGAWVKANSVVAPALVANENVKQPGQPTSASEESLTDLLRIFLLKEAMSDEAIIHFREDATPHFDPQADAWKLKNEVMNLSTLSEDGDLLAINSWSGLVCEDTIKLSIDDAPVGQYQLKFSNLDSFGEDAQINLVDKLLNQVVEIHDDFSYPVAITSDPASFGSERFLVIARRNAGVTISQVDGMLSVPYEKNIQWFFNDVAIEGANSSTLVPDATGTYRVVVKQADCELSGSIEFTVTGVENSLPPEIHIYPNPASNEFFVSARENSIESITVVNDLGNAMGKISFKNSEGTQSGRFDLRGVPSGLYLLIIKSRSRTYTAKLVKK